jgi:hypothetical protein
LTASKEHHGAYSEGGQDAIVILGVLPHPRVTVVDVGLQDVQVYDFRHNDKPFGEEVSLE